ncbi:tyrosine-type recombinase/integrase, partial [Klebsiella pneumoniae]
AAPSAKGDDKFITTDYLQQCRMEKARIWEITDRTVRTWLSEAVESAAADGVTFSVPVTPHTFRHSYAMHMLYAGIPLKVLQSLMGHKSISSTEVYTKVFALDVAARHRVQFAMPEAEAVALIKKLTEVVNKNWPPR